MWQWITENLALWINLHQAGFDMFHPEGFRAYMESWAESKNHD